MMNRVTPDFRKLFESAPGLFLVLEADFTVAEASDAYLKAASTERSALIGKNFFDAFPDPSRVTRDSLEKVLETQRPVEVPSRRYEMPDPHREGATVTKYWSFTNTPVLSPAGSVAFIIRRADDVTEVVQSEDEKKALAHERDLIFSHSFDLLGIVSPDGYFKRLNPSFERTLGYTEKELCSRPLVEFMHPDDVAKTKKGLQTLASGTPTIASMNRYRCKNGEYKWFSWNTIPVGENLYTVGRDITEQVERDEQIKHLNAELAKKNEDLELKIQERLAELRRTEDQVQQLQKMDAIGRLAGGIAHDFNNILAAISMHVELLAEDADDAEAVRKRATDIEETVTRASALTRQLLVFSRKQLVQHQVVDLNKLIKQLEKMLIRLIGENIKIVTKLADDLGSVKVDPSQMEQVILNLVVNARDAMPNGGPVTIETSNVYLDEAFTSTHLSVSRGHYVLLSVSDKGSGMDASTLSKIFEPFFTTKPVGKGTGLGLTTTYGIIKQSHGTIWVYSEVGKGTVFKIYLPIAEKAAEEPEVVSVVTPIARGTQTILLVEDDESLRAGFSAALERKGYRVLVAANGVQALSVLETYGDKIDLLLTDVVMPEMSGFELAEKAVALRKEIRVLYMSGYTSDTLDDAKLEHLDQIAFIQKPFDTRALIAKIHETLA